MWIANFLVAASATMVLPFISLYIETFGNFSDAYVQRWAGYIFGITFLVAFFAAPLWGKIGDRYGRKIILILTGYGIAVCILCMGFAQSVEGLFVIRLLMGIVTGFIPTATALISAQSAKKNAGDKLGTLQTGTVSGGLLGPVLGGLLADTTGYFLTFIITSGVITAAATLVWIGLKEVVYTDKNETTQTFSSKEIILFICKRPVLLLVIGMSMIIQTANFSIQPLLALYVNNLHHSENIAFLAGVAFSVTGLGNLVATRKWGRFGDRVGHEKIIVVLLVLSACFFIPQAFVTSIWQLIILRFLFGMQIGGLIPCMTAYIRQICPISMQGEVLGYHISFRFLGNVFGPIIGGIIAGMLNISFVFVLSGSLFIISACILWIVLQRERQSSHHLTKEDNVKHHTTLD
ncbi:MFS transporter [Alteribacillus bidgolensis]|uniref:Predicted arabinose efflux permease, MFS family n=1 Tax=Alteribacillus bidgolensis TaxID=930129 RepID=A0A1G8EKY6_9BACI|nr:MFS transporter [Alteribacillus bidgolensis]SDH70452.1 Predicted arabinose efflux permease, MFS family [Alteribacillus bidgolensis]